MRNWIQSVKSIYNDIEHLLSGGNETCYHTMPLAMPLLQKDSKSLSRHLFDNVQHSFHAGLLLQREGHIWKLDRHFGFQNVQKKFYQLPEVSLSQVKRAKAGPVLKHWGLQTKPADGLMTLIFAPSEDVRFVLFTNAPSVILYDKTEKLLDYLSQALAA